MNSFFRPVRLRVEPWLSCGHGRPEVQLFVKDVVIRWREVVKRVDALDAGELQVRWWDHQFA